MIQGTNQKSVCLSLLTSVSHFVQSKVTRGPQEGAGHRLSFSAPRGRRQDVFMITIFRRLSIKVPNIKWIMTKSCILLRSAMFFVTLCASLLYVNHTLNKTWLWIIQYILLNPSPWTFKSGWFPVGPSLCVPIKTHCWPLTYSHH